MSRRRLPPPRGGQRGHGDPLAGMPVGRYEPLTPMGELEQAGKLISGLSRRGGWRRRVMQVAAVAVVCLLLALAVITVIRLFGV